MLFTYIKLKYNKTKSPYLRIIIPYLFASKINIAMKQNFRDHLATFLLWMP